MHEQATLENTSLQPRVSRWRKRLLVISLIVLPFLLFGASFFFLVVWQDIQLQKAIAETDQLDPGWRIWDLEANRAVLPDDRNSAVPLAAAKKLLGPRWPQQVS